MCLIRLFQITAVRVQVRRNCMILQSLLRSDGEPKRNLLPMLLITPRHLHVSRLHALLDSEEALLVHCLNDETLGLPMDWPYIHGCLSTHERQTI